MGIKAFFKKAFGDMKESTKAQHEADKAEFAAAKAEEKRILKKIGLTTPSRKRRQTRRSLGTMRI